MRYHKDYDDYDYQDDKPREVIDIERKLGNAREFVTALYQELTSREPLDLHSIYHYMSEISAYLDIDDRQFGDLNISRESKILQFAGV